MPNPANRIEPSFLFRFNAVPLKWLALDLPMGYSPKSS
jgi:hypothetical protein